MPRVRTRPAPCTPRGDSSSGRGRSRASRGSTDAERRGSAPRAEKGRGGRAPRRRGGGTSSRLSDSTRRLRPPLSEKAFRKKDQDEHEDDESEGVLVAEADVDGAERFGEAEHEASQHRARDVPHPAEDGDDERL